MGEYNVGDKVYLEGKISDYDESDNTYCVDYFSYHKDTQLTNWVKDDVLHTPDESYNKGLNDAWELAKKIVGSPSNGGYTANELVVIFGIVNKPVLDTYTPQEAIAKVKAYEEKCNKIKVGDVVKSKSSGIERIVTRVTETIIYCLFRDGSCVYYPVEKYFVKTGHFDSIDEFMKS